jgi:hypothetical protein
MGGALLEREREHKEQADSTSAAVIEKESQLCGWI